MAEISSYEAMILKSRVDELNIIKKQEDALMKVLTQAHANLSKAMDDIAYPSDKLKFEHIKDMQQEIERVMDDVYGKRGAFGKGNMQQTIIEGATQASKAAVDGKYKAGMLYLKDINPDLIADLPAMFGGIPDKVVKNLLTRKLDDGQLFSQRIWKLRDYTDNVVSQTITQGILESKSAREIAKDLEAFLIQKAEGRAALHGLPHKQAWHRGDVVYNTQRLARTEINNAFREAQVETAKNASYIKGVKWRLSVSHPVADICDTWASQDLYEMGPGCYPPDKAPIDHPNGLCFLTDILKTRDEMMQSMRT